MISEQSEFILLRKAAYQIITLLILLISFQYFTNSPLADYITNVEQLFTVTVMLFIVIYLLNKLLQTQRLDAIDMLVLSMSFGIPLYSAVMAKLYWGQPLINGFTTQKFWFIGLGSLVVFYFLTNKFISLTEIHRLMLGVAWVSLVLYIGAEVVFDAGKFRGSSFVYCNEAKGGCGFKFNNFFLGYAMLFYFIKAIRMKQNIWLIASALFFAYFLFFLQKRGIVITTAIIFFLILIFNTTAKRFTQYISLSAAIFLVALGGLFLISPQKFNTLIGQYGNFIDVIQGEETGEGSADSRLSELLTMNKFASQHPSAWIFGNGKWSDNWGGNLSLVEKFFPSDLGIVGVFFVYGVIGFLLVHIQFIYMFRWMRRYKFDSQPLLYTHIKYFLLYYYLRSIFSGYIFFASGPSVTLFFIMIIYYFKKYESHVRLS